MKIIKLFLILLFTGTFIFAGTFIVDPIHSNVGFKVKHMMISYVNGKFDKFEGAFEYDEKSKTIKSLEGIVFTESINTENQKRDDHLKSSDFFDVKNFPTMTLKITKVLNNNAEGILTIRGISKNIKINIDPSNEIVKDPWGNFRTGVSLNFQINRKDFGLNWNKILETGGVMVGDDVKVQVDIEGILKK